MKIKTYGINGLSEWHGELKAGSISVKVSFTGGTVSPSGAQPAYMVSKDPITQFVIENSKEYKSGFIHLEMVQDAPGDHPRMAVPKHIAVTQVDETPVEVPEQEPEQEADGVQKVTVADKSEAVEWLKEHYPDKGYTQRGLRNKADFDAACQECGVKFSY